MASTLLTNLIATDVPDEQLLAAGHHRDTGTLAQLTKHQLEKLVPAAAGLGMSYDTVLRLARFPVERALRVKRGATDADLVDFDAKAYTLTSAIYTTHAAKQDRTTAQRSAPKVNDETVVTEATKTPGKKAGAKQAAKKTAAKKTVAKKAAKKTSGDSAAVRYAGKKIKALVKEHTARPGTKRAIGMDILLKAKTTDEALEKFAKHDGIDASFIRHAVDQGYIQLS